MTSVVTSDGRSDHDGYVTPTAAMELAKGSVNHSQTHSIAVELGRLSVETCELIPSEDVGEF